MKSLQGVDLACQVCDAHLSEGGANLDYAQARRAMMKHARETGHKTFSRVVYEVVDVE